MRDVGESFSAGMGSVISVLTNGVSGGDSGAASPGNSSSSEASPFSRFNPGEGNDAVWVSKEKRIVPLFLRHSKKDMHRY